MIDTDIQETPSRLYIAQLSLVYTSLVHATGYVWSLDAELSMGWIDPRVGLGREWVENLFSVGWVGSWV